MHSRKSSIGTCLIGFAGGRAADSEGPIENPADVDRHGTGGKHQMRARLRQRGEARLLLQGRA